MASTNLIASLSKSTTMVSIKPVKYRCMTSAGMATMSPAAVVNKASDIPPASALALPVPTVVICAKTSIIPTTVPKRPNSGAMAATVLIHIIDPKPRLFIIGAVHIAQELVKLATIADFEITLIDPRDHFATKKRFPNCQIINDWPDIALSKFKFDKATHLVTLTHDPKIDDPALVYSLKKNIGYVGSLGSKKTHQKRCERLSLLGFNQNDLNKIHGPIGLDIKAKNPAEIAISILGEIIQFRRAN